MLFKDSNAERHLICQRKCSQVLQQALSLKKVSVKCEENEAPVVASLPTKPQGRLLMLGKTLI